MAKSIEEYTKEIEEIKNKNESMLDSMERQSEILLEKSIDFLKERIKHEIEYCVKSNTTHTKELAEQDKLKDVKIEMNKLLEEVPQYTDDAMGGDSVFIHRTLKIDKNKSAYEYKDVVRKKYRNAYGIVVGWAGKILYKYGYIKVGNDYNGYSQWQYISGSGGRIKYGYGFDMREIEDDWEKYVDTLMKYYEGLLKYQLLQKSKEEAEAMNLWESI